MSTKPFFRFGQIFWNRLSHQLLRPKRLAIVEACLIGLAAGMAAVLLGQSVGWFGGWRQHMTHRLPVYVVLPLIGFVGGFLGGWLVDRFAPEASGSGMSEVKAVLARVPLPLNLRIALVKLISASLVLSCGMPLGREGPTVQIGAALANQLSRWVPTSPAHRRQLIAAGAGAGLAAAFDAPIAGVLFVVEELLQDVSGITLGTAILASFIASVFARVYGSRSLDLDLHLVAPNTSFAAPEIPFYLLLGICAGVLGALFNQGILASLKLNRRFLKVGLPWRVGLAGLVAGCVLIVLPAFRDNAGLRQLLLTGDASWSLVAIVLVAQFLLILITFGSGAPGGLLVPSLVLGAALGYLIGIWEHHTLGLGIATTYARVGMGGFFCAVARVPITSVILVFEMTTDFNLVLPLMIVCVSAYLVAEKVAAGSLYDRLLEWKGIHLEKEAVPNALWIELTAADVMQPRVETLSSRMGLDEAVEAFSRSSHRNFPVVEGGRLVGVVTQTDLVPQTPQGISKDLVIADVMTPEPVTVEPGDTLAHVLNLLNRYNLSCLPVTEGRKLVGIITRSDIIRVEAIQLNGGVEQFGPKPEPSRVIYQSRSPETGQGRLLVPISNPKTAKTLLEMAVAIARERNYEIECLSVLVLPRHQVLREAMVRTQQSQRLLRQAVQLGYAWQVPIHTQIRVTHDLASAILETIKAQHVDLVLMGWKGGTTTPGRIFSRVVDTVIRQAACDVVLVKLGEQILPQRLNAKVPANADAPHPSFHFDRWLVPMAGGPNVQQAVKLLPALMSLSKAPELKLYQVFGPEDPKLDTTGLEKAAHYLRQQLHSPVLTVPVRAESIADAVVTYARQNRSDVIVLGASREGMLQQVMNGNIPEAISRSSQCTVILIRGKLD